MGGGDWKHKNKDKNESHKALCISGESNPGRIDGNDSSYHWTTDAILVVRLVRPFKGVHEEK